MVPHEVANIPVCKEATSSIQMFASKGSLLMLIGNAIDIQAAYQHPSH